jgi:signal peptidase I
VSAAAKEHKSRTPWRDNIEAMSVAIIMAVMFKYFALEAYQIPTGSMQPTLMGQDFPPERPGTQKPIHVQWLDKLFGEGGSIKDRILVDKLSFHVRDPKRWEVVIFKYPLNRAQNFVKRLVGMPGEHLRIAYGDVWRRENASDAWRIVSGVTLTLPSLSALFL